MIHTKAISAFLALILCFSAASLTSCLESSEISNNELSETGLIINAGDTNNITIESSESLGTLSASKALLSAVSIYSGFEIKYSSYFGTYCQNETHAGSGVIYKIDKNAGDAYIITNYHVVYDAQSTSENGISPNISAYLYGQESSDYALKAQYIGGSMLYDIAVLKVSGSRTLIESCAVSATVADSDEISVLESAIVIGNPAQLGISATVGSISRDSEYITMTASDERTTTTMRVIRTDAAVNGGNSGGGLFNAYGDLIGIVNAKITSSSIENIGYAIPSNVATRIADNIIANYDGTQPQTLKKCMLGITSGVTEQKTVYDEQTGKVHRMETVAVAQITEGSLAEGALYVGDILKSAQLGDKTITITKSHQLSELLLSARPGDVLAVQVLRPGEEKTVSITLTDSCVTEYI